MQIAIQLNASVESHACPLICQAVPTRVQAPRFDGQLAGDSGEDAHATAYVTQTSLQHSFTGDSTLNDHFCLTDDHFCLTAYSAGAPNSSRTSSHVQGPCLGLPQHTLRCIQQTLSTPCSVTGQILE